MKQHLLPKNKAIFLDRDGVLNRALIREGRPYPPQNINEVEILAGVPIALKLLKSAGFLLITVSNQPDVARGTLSRETVDAINSLLCAQLPIDHFVMCYHDNGDRCECRKPKPGMIISSASKFNIDLGKSYMIGDRWRDIVAGSVAGCKTVFLDYKYDEQRPESFNYITESLLEAAKLILSAEVSRNTGPYRVDENFY